MSDLMPGQGWLVTYLGEDGSTWTDPVVAWTLDDGPWVTDAEGCLDSLYGMATPYVVWHPGTRRDEAVPAWVTELLGDRGSKSGAVK